MKYLNALSFSEKILKSSNIKSFILDSELLLSNVLNSTREKLLINLDNKIKKKKFEEFKKLVLRRKNKEPIAYILKTKEFWKYNFKVNKEVLIPRPETEIVVNEVLKITNSSTSKHILDIGTGSGCILLSILKERPKCRGTAVDISKKAINTAISNAKMHHLENKVKFINIDIDNLKENNYDLIVSNPPYIDNIKLKRLDCDIKLYEPIVALKAGIDGLSEIKKLVLRSKKILKQNGKLIFEIGEKQLNKVLKLLNENNFYVNRVCKDLNSLPRVIVATKSP